MPQPEESRAEQLARNWSELLQEVRVIQTGVQVLTGFLLTVPFSARFEDLDDLQRSTFLAVLSGSVIATALLLTPSACHRLLFRRGERPWLIAMANRVALAGLAVVGLTTAGVMFLAFDVVLGGAAGIVAGVATLALFMLLWSVLPSLLPHT